MHEVWGMAERFLENPEWRLLLVVGGLGGFTTFSDEVDKFHGKPVYEVLLDLFFK